jgi:hypothetical protein
MKAMPMLASMWPSFRHNGILQFIANGKLRHKNASSICWRQGGFAGNRIWRAEKLWRTFITVTLVLHLCKRWQWSKSRKEQSANGYSILKNLL